MTIARAKIRWNGWGWAAHKDELAGREALWTWLAGELGMPALLATPARPLESIALPPPKLAPEALARFAGTVGADRVRGDDYERAFHALGKSYHDLLRLRAGDLSTAPDAVLYPRSGEEVLAVLAAAAELGVAVVPYGGGTSVVGGVTGGRGAFKAVVTLDLSGMDRLVEIDAVARTATAEAGIYGPALEKALAAKGFTLGHHPQSFEFSTLGGWIAHRGAGQGSGRYGRAEDWLIGARLATPRGSLSAGGFPASAAGPSLLALAVGSEGAFGVVTEATVRLHKLPAASDYRGYLFRDFASGTAAIREAVQSGLGATMLRLSDAAETRFYRAYGAIGKRRGIGDRLAQIYLDTRGVGDKACAMIAGFEGEDAEVARGRAAFAALARKHRALALGEGQGKRWKDGRFHGPYLRDPMMERGAGVDTLETATGWSKIEALAVAVRDALEKTIRETAPRDGAHGVVMCHISHSYPDGASLYFTYIFPRALEREIAQWQAIKTAASDAIAANGGTLSHHHGVGEDHLPWMAGEKGALGIDVLRAVKMALDPKGVMNPGKLIPG
ncbi:MAG TPA: FAD-binding oxidoreductase [Rhizomicrobium sp.]|jgi:alkyldihydroxyacetonephosphate synthase|nr:FAD-binding oxidoreductase [Rhizomicrobium sp.]